MTITSTSRRLLVGLALILGLVGAGAALVHTDAAAAKGGKAHAGLLKVAADYIEITPRVLVTELRNDNKSLAEVAVAHDKTRDGLKQALKDAITARIGSSKRLTAEQKAKALAGLDARLDKLVDHKGSKVKRGKVKRAFKGGLLKVAADYLDLTPKELVAELRKGQSLAQIAVAKGKTAEGLKQAELDAVRARLDQAVADKKLTPAQRDQIMQRVEEHLDKLLNRTFRPR